MLHEFYEEFLGTRIARKHVGWCLDTLLSTHTGVTSAHDSAKTVAFKQWKQDFNRLSDPRQQLRHLEEIESRMEHLTTDRPVGELAA